MCIPPANSEQLHAVQAASGVCLTWEGEQGPEQQTVPLLPSFEGSLCCQVSGAPLAPGVQQLGATGAVPTLSPAHPPSGLCLTKRHNGTASVLRAENTPWICTKTAAKREIVFQNSQRASDCLQLQG